MTSENRPIYLDQASEFLYATTLGSMSVQARARATSIFADCIAVIAAGMQVKEMQSFYQAHSRTAAKGGGSIIGTGSSASALDAALLNGTAGTWLELDEGNLFAMGHPGIQIVPAAFAVAQEIGSSGAELLRAVALGYELSARIARSATLRIQVHPHGTYGVIGAAIAVGLLKKFNAQQLRELLNVSATMGLATSRNTLLEGATVRNIYTGHSAYMGQMAVKLVEAGFTGEKDGVGTTFGKVLSDTFDAQRVVAALGSEWLIAQNYFKLHCTGRYVHSAIDALEDALTHVDAQALNIGVIERIEVKAYKFAAMLSGKKISTSFGARFSIPFALATILYHGKSDLKAFDEEAVANPDIQKFMQRIDVVEEPTFNLSYPAKQRCSVEIILQNGTRVVGNCFVTKGESAKPHTAAELKNKFMNLGTPIWGQDQTIELFETLSSLETIQNMADFSERFTL
jgi:2-methylcitrate dehydratase PrpD